MRKLYVILLKNSIAFFSILFFFLSVSGQNNNIIHLPINKAYSINPATQSCATDGLLNQLRKQPAFRAKENNMNQQILSVSGTLGADSYVLPVVFHIINPNPASITDAQVLAAFNDLNDAFAKRGAYAASTGADTKIQFCMAHTDLMEAILQALQELCLHLWGSI